ncbi:Hpt domain-containing protein [Ciceribacter sp. L1K23]|uniref:Hpt domain-containing protein n=1 Tax=Ciceribacter sp. L1K23 TaxID=2820276 RepID=UPI001B83F999|nr:Hpt domain-containing protein [Ciceribacter sp. L1K23]MBR0555270.1 Hpt domain-containing protein [Ciceribacter sp. L1K23]
MAALNIAFEPPVNATAATASLSRPVDLVFLAAQAQGDKEREIEALKAYSRQARACLLDLVSQHPVTIAGAAARLKGAAGQIGAQRVIDAAEALERDGASAANLAVVSAAIVEAENFILKLCR